MHMLMVIAGGIVLLGVFLLFGHLWDGAVGGMAGTARAFIPIWLLVALANLWIGVSHAGYTIRQELPILAIVAAIPIVIAGSAAWYFAKP